MRQPETKCGVHGAVLTSASYDFIVAQAEGTGGTAGNRHTLTGPVGSHGGKLSEAKPLYDMPTEAY